MVPMLSCSEVGIWVPQSCNLCLHSGGHSGASLAKGWTDMQEASRVGVSACVSGNANCIISWKLQGGVTEVSWLSEGRQLQFLDISRAQRGWWYLHASFNLLPRTQKLFDKTFKPKAAKWWPRRCICLANTFDLGYIMFFCFFVFFLLMNLIPSI